MTVPGTQTTLESDVFGPELRERVDDAKAVRGRCIRLFRELNRQREGEWQPAVIDRAIHYATSAIKHADGELYFDYLELAEESLEAAKYAFPEVELR